jgi:hypothetical protein
LCSTIAFEKEGSGDEENYDLGDFSHAGDAVWTAADAV